MSSLRDDTSIFDDDYRNNSLAYMYIWKVSRQVNYQLDDTDLSLGFSIVNACHCKAMFWQL